MSVMLLVIVAATASWFAWTQVMSHRRRLDIPYLQFTGNNSQPRYTSETKSLMDKGYNEYLKNGLPFSIRNPSDPKNPLVIMPMKYLEEVRSAPTTKLSFPKFLEKSAILNDVGVPTMTDEAITMARIDLTRALNNLIEPMQEQCLAAYRDTMPPCKDWTSIQPYQILLKIFTRVTARVLVGPGLCNNDQWLETTVQYTNTVLKSIPKVRAKYHPSIRWLAKYFDPDARLVVKYRDQAAAILRPVLQARIRSTQQQTAEGKPAAGDSGDAVQWLVGVYQSRGLKLTPEKLAQDELNITVASIHSSSATALMVLFDLMEHRDSLAEIKEEIAQVRKEHPVWNRSALAALRTLDSFMKESQRLNTLTQLTMQRLAVSSYTFKDGFHLPVGTRISFASQQLNLDSEVHPNAQTFDPERWLRKRQAIDPARFHFASVSDDSINWGGGLHACPGRFLAQEALKLMFVHLLTEYDVKYPEERQARPPNGVHNFNIMPPVAAPLLFKKLS